VKQTLAARDDAAASATSAATSATTAQTAAAQATAPTDTTMASKINTAGSATRVALDAAIASGTATKVDEADLNTLWVPATEFTVHAGTPAAASVGGGYPAFLFDAAAAEQVSLGVLLPDWMTAVNVLFVWCNYGTGTGNVRWRVVHTQNAGPANSLLTGVTAETGVVATADAQYIRVDTQVVAALPVTGRLLSLRAWREADNATDTLANDAALFGVLIEAA
jgi:hypothetical protein